MHRLMALWATLLLIFLAITFPASARASQPERIRFVTFNVNFNNSNQKIRDDVQAVATRADVIMFQEAKGVTINNFLDSSWTVLQVVDQGDAKRGSAIALRNSKITNIINWGLVLGCNRYNYNILNRYILWADVRFTNDQVLRVMALHFPPLRLKQLWPEMAGNFATFSNASPHPTMAGGDWNFIVTNDPENIQNATGLKARGVHIDGFFYDESVVEFELVRSLTGLNVNSDHDPVQMIGHVQPPVSHVKAWELY